MSTKEELKLAMPFGLCWKALLDLEIQKVLDALNIEKPISKLSLANVAATADTNIISTYTDKGLQTSRPCLFRIYVVLGTSGIFSVMRTAANATQKEKLNAAVALTANAAYIFDVIVDPGENIDFQTSATGTVLKLSVLEKDDAK